MERIPFCSPSISQREVQCVAESVPQCTDDTAGDFQHHFEHSFANYIGARHAIAVSSRGAAVHVALAALGVGPGHEVIVPDILPATSLLPLRFLGATPVFVDIDPNSWCLSAESFKQAITPRTKVVMPVDLYGNIPEMHRIRAIARARGIVVVEDASDAVGGTYLGRRAGSLGDVGLFGFDRAETLTSGEGGMVVTDCDRLANNVRQSLEDAGFDYHLSPMQAALGAAQLERIDDLVARKRQVAAWYRQALGGVNNFTMCSTTLSASCVPSEFTLILDRESESVIQGLSLCGIEARRMPAPASSLSTYASSPQARVARSRNRVSYQISPCGISLPSGTNLTRRQVEDVAGALVGLIARHTDGQPQTRKAA